MAGVELPAELIALIKYVEAIMAEVGVPVMRQVTGLRVAHAGRAGVTVQLVMAAPFALMLVGLTVIGTPTAPLVPRAPV